MRVVLIDLQNDARARLAAMLEEEGHEVFQESNSRRGLRRLGQSRFDVLIAEVMMPTMDGLEVIKAARRIHPDLWIIAMSGEASPLSAYTALTLARAFGADRILYRPFQRKDLFDAIERR